MRNFFIAAALVVSTACASAEEQLNCLDPQDQTSMTQCAGLDFEKADKELNAIWPALKAQAIEDDKAEGKGLHDTEDALMASQRAWLAFRDAECKWQGFAAHGGSMEPMLVNICAAKLTRDRVKQLQTGVSE